MSLISSWINNTLYSVDTKPDMDSSKLLDISNALSNLKRTLNVLQNEEFEKKENVETIEQIAKGIGERIPTMIVVGTQSSGKSSVLNKIMKFPILPTGSMMVTRTPISIELRTNTDRGENEYVEIGEYREGKWYSNGKIIVNTEQEYDINEKVEKIKRGLEKATNKIAGNQKNVVSKPIYVRARLNNVHDLNIIDLPGLIMTALKDKGQHEDTPKQLLELIKSYIVGDNTIILGIFQSRPDLEADYAFSILKENANMNNVIGVLTKPDLMEDKSTVLNLLKGDISKDLYLQQKYFVVRSDVSNQEENKYFRESQYNNLTNVGTESLALHCSRLQLQMVMDKLPTIKDDIIKLNDLAFAELETLSAEIPKDGYSRMRMLVQFSNNIARKITSQIRERGNRERAGKDIKHNLCLFREIVFKIQPFDMINYPENYFNDIVDRMEGNHMSFEIPCVDVLEAIIQDQEYHPLYCYKQSIDNTLNELIEILRETTKKAIEQTICKRFPLLNEVLLDTSEKYLTQLRRTVSKESGTLVDCQESYIWTDNLNFKRSMEGFRNGPNAGLKAKEIAAAYMVTVAESLADTVPKSLMYHLIDRYCENIKNKFTENINSEKVEEIIIEDSKITKRRNILKNIEETCKNVLTII